MPFNGAGRPGSANAPAAHTAVLFQTHFFDAALARVFDKIRADCPPGYEAHLLMHRPPGTEVPLSLLSRPHHIAPTAEVRLPAYLGKTGFLPGGAPMPGWGVRDSGHTELVPLHFHRHHPGYEHYWVIEYDVRFSGIWGDLFRHFEASKADLLAASMRTAEDHPDWMYWDTLETPLGIPAPSPAESFSCFLPVYRTSRRAMDALDQGYRAGWSGHAEVATPTVIRHAGLELEDMGGEGRFTKERNRGRWYSNQPLDLAGAPGTFVARPVRFRIGSEPNMLWHPVKPLTRTVLDKAGKTVGSAAALLKRPASRPAT